MLDEVKIGELTKERLNNNIERLNKEIEDLVLEREIYTLLLIKKEREGK